MSTLNKISKKAKIIITVAACTVLIITAWIVYFTACNKLDIPEITISAENGGSARAIRGGFEWTYCGRHTLADSLSPLDFDYKAENILTTAANDQLFLSNKNAEGGKKHPFILDALIYYPEEGNPVKIDTGEFIIKNGDLTINAPMINGQYIYDLTLKYERGTVVYGFKVIVTDDGLPVETTDDSTTVNPLDAEFWFPMTNHLHTFSFDGKEFTPDDDFMAEHTILSDLDASAYFEVDTLCKYARELSALSESQIDAITAYQDIKTIGEHRYINLIDLRALGVYTTVGWELSSHTPVYFSTKEPVYERGD